MSLERVIGNTAKGNSAFSVNPVNGDLAYPAGCILVIFSPRRNRQTHFFSSSNQRPLSCAAFSNDGAVVCAGEGGRQPSVLVWDTSSGDLLAELKGHSFSVRAVCVSGNGQRLATVGSQGDGRLNLWEWRTGTLLASTRANVDVQCVCLSHNGQELLTAGKQGHMRKWVIDPAKTTGKCGTLRGLKFTFDGGPPSQGDFTDAALSPPDNNNNNNNTNKSNNNTSLGSVAYAVTEDGFLLCFDPHRVLARWVDLHAAPALALSVTDRYVACACAGGVVRVFSPRSLEYVCSVPRPPPFRAPAPAPAQSRDDPDGSRDAAERQSVESAQSEAPSAGRSQRAEREGAGSAGPDAVGVRVAGDGRRVACLYADRSVVVWDISDRRRVHKCRSLHAHSDSIWDIDFLPRDACRASGLPEDSFVTCSSDASIRLWALPPVPSSPHFRAAAKPSSIKELRCIRHLDAPSAPQQALSAHGETSRCGGAIRCLRVSPDGKHLAAGDRAGNVWVHAVSAQLEEQECIEAHDAEVLCVDYGGAAGQLLASSSRDRLVHVFDRSAAYALSCTLDDHAAAVTAVRFAAGGRKLVSAGGDKRIILRNVSGANGRVRVNANHAMSVPSSTVYDLAVDPSGRSVLAAGQDGGPVVLDVASGQKERSFESDAETTLRIRTDPTGAVCATSSSDRTIRVYDTLVGDALLTAAGHAEPITGLAFSFDLERLVSVSGDGCILVWRLPAAVSGRMKDARSELLRQVSLKTPLDPVPESKPLLGGETAATSPSPSSPSKSKSPRKKLDLEFQQSNDTDAAASRLNSEPQTGPAGDRDESVVSETAAAADRREALLVDGGAVGPDSTHSSGFGPMEDDSDEEPLSDGGKELLDKEEEREQFEVRVSAHELGGMLGPMSREDEDFEKERVPPSLADDDLLDVQQIDIDLAVSSEQAHPPVGVNPARLSLSSLHKSALEEERAALAGVVTAAREECHAASQSVRMDDSVLLETPRSNIIRESDLTGISTPSTPDRSGSRLGQDKTRALAAELEKMRNQLQSMGMCGGLTGAVHPTPDVSAAPSVHSSPAKPVVTHLHRDASRFVRRPPDVSEGSGWEGKRAAASDTRAVVAPSDTGVVGAEGSHPRPGNSLDVRVRLVETTAPDQGPPSPLPSVTRQQDTIGAKVISARRGDFFEVIACDAEAPSCRPATARPCTTASLSLAEERRLLKEEQERRTREVDSDGATPASKTEAGSVAELDLPPPPAQKRPATAPNVAKTGQDDCAEGIDVRLKLLGQRRKQRTPVKGLDPEASDKASREVTPLKVAHAQLRSMTEETKASVLWSETQMDERRKAAAAAAENIRKEIEEAKRRADEAERALSMAQEEAVSVKGGEDVGNGTSPCECFLQANVVGRDDGVGNDLNVISSLSAVVEEDAGQQTSTSSVRGQQLEQDTTERTMTADDERKKDESQVGEEEWRRREEEVRSKLLQELDEERKRAHEEELKREHAQRERLEQERQRAEEEEKERERAGAEERARLKEEAERAMAEREEKERLQAERARERRELEETRRAVEAARREKLEAQRKVAETEQRVVETESRVAAAEREMRKLRETEAALRIKAVEEAAAREEVRSAALGALLVVQKVQHSLEDPTLAGSDLVRGSKASATAATEHSSASVDSQHLPAELKESVLSWARELAVEVVSPVTVSGRDTDGAESVELMVVDGDGGAGEEEDGGEDEIAEGRSEQVGVRCGPEVFDAFSGAGELEDASLDEGEGRAEEAGGKDQGGHTEHDGWERGECSGRVEAASGADTLLAARDSAASRVGSHLQTNAHPAEAASHERWSQVEPFASLEAPNRGMPAGASLHGQRESRDQRMQRGGMMVKAARSADPNHPLNVGDASRASLDTSVCSSVLDDYTASGACPGQLTESLQTTLNLLTVARAAGREEVTERLIEVLRSSQQQIERTLQSIEERDCDVTTIHSRPAPSGHGGDHGRSDFSHRRAARDDEAEGGGGEGGSSSALPSGRTSMDMDGSGADRSHFGTNMSAISGSKVEEVLERYSEQLVTLVTHKVGVERPNSSESLACLEERRGTLI